MLFGFHFQPHNHWPSPDPSQHASLPPDLSGGGGGGGLGRPVPQQSRLEQRFLDRTGRRPAWAAASDTPPPLPMAVHPVATLPRASPMTQQHSSLITLPEEIYESIYDTRWRLMNKVGEDEVAK